MNDDNDRKKSSIPSILHIFQLINVCLDNSNIRNKIMKNIMENMVRIIAEEYDPEDNQSNEIVLPLIKELMLKKYLDANDQQFIYDEDVKESFYQKIWETTSIETLKQLLMIQKISANNIDRIIWRTEYSFPVLNDSLKEKIGVLKNNVISEKNEDKK